jgi:DNA replication protein DnaC
MSQNDELDDLLRRLSVPLSDEEKQRRLAIASDELRRQRTLRTAILRENWNAPKRHLLRDELDVSGPWGAKLKQLVDLIGTGCFVGLVGTRGAGKTQLAVEAMKTATERGLSSYYIDATELFLRVKATFENDETELEVMRSLQRPKLLVIDEVWRRGQSDWENRLFFMLLDHRYQAMKDTVLVSTQTREAFTESVGDALASRMNETGGVMECDWPSFRL